MGLSDIYKDRSFQALKEQGNKVITQDDIKNNKELHDDIIAKFRNWYYVDGAYVNDKRQLIKDLQNKYTDPTSDFRQKIKVHTMHSNIKAFMAAFRDQAMNVTFTDNQSIDEDLSYFLEKSAEFDAVKMGKDLKDKLNLWHALLFGVGLRARTTYNKQYQCPEYMQIHPDSWIPDVNGNIFDNNFEYHIFETYTTYYDLDCIEANGKNIYFDIDKLTRSSFIGDDAREIHKKNQRLLNPLNDYYKSLRILNIYCTVNGRKYIASVGNSCSLIIRWEEIPAVLEEEKENPYLIQFPISITNVFPLYEDPFGLGYGEIIISPQSAINKLTNLMIRKEERNAWFANYLVDTTKITNLDALALRSDEWPNFIPGKSRDWSPISNAISPVEEERVDSNTPAVIDRIDMSIQMQTSMTSQNKWVIDAGTTLWQSRISQGNTNVIFELDYDFISIGEQMFWKNIWFRSFLQYMSDTDEKVYRITKGFGRPTIKLKKKDFKSCYDPYIQILPKKVSTEKNKQQVAYLVMKYQVLSANPTTKPVILSILAREIDRMNGVNRDMIYLTNPYSNDELRAKDYCVMINAGIKPKNMFVPGMDLFTYYVYVSYCEDNDVKKNVMLQLEAMMQEEWNLKEAQQQVQGMQQWGMEAAQSQRQNNQSASNASMMWANYIQSMSANNQEPTLADVRR
jgi:hypothetical protein